MNKELNEAAEKYAFNYAYLPFPRSLREVYLDGMESDAAKEYWYAQFKIEQKQNADNEVNEQRS